MAITFVAETHTTYANRTNTTINAPAGLTDDDYLLVCILTGAASEAPDPTEPGGFTLLTNFPTSAGDASFEVEMRVYGKVASGEGSSWTFTHANCSSQGWAIAYRGVNTTTPLDATPVINSRTFGGTSGVTVMPSITTVTSGAMVVCLMHDWGSLSNTLVVLDGTTPTFTLRIEAHPLIYVADGILDVAGATGTKNLTNNNIPSTSDAWASATIALRPTVANVVHLPAPAEKFQQIGPGALSVYNGTTWDVIKPGANTFFVATGGSDAAVGSEAEPWATVAFAATQLQAGDTVIVSGGTYYEPGVAVTADGRRGRPITIKAKTGETPIIDGSLAAYRTTGNTAWEVHDATRHIYRTTATLPDPGTYGYSGRIDVDGTLYALTIYRDTVATGLETLSADADLYDPASAYYMGPGICYHSDSRVYIRLDPNSDAAQWVDDPVGEAPLVISDLDPRNHAIHITDNNGGFAINGNWVTLDGIHLRHHWTTTGGAGTDVTVKNLTMWPTRFGARTDGDRWTFDNVTVEAHRPPWIARSDVKAGAEPAENNRTGGISWEGASGGTLTNSTISGFFDGTLPLGNNVGLTITHNHFDNCMDDAMQLGSASYDIDFGYNLITGASISHDGSGGDAADTPDTVYIHHNVIDTSVPMFLARKPIEGVDPSENGDGGYVRAPAIGSHGIPDFDDPWKVYNNTFVASYAPGVQGVNHYMYHGATPGEGVHEAYNNIININATGIRLYRNANASTGLEIYDYNIYARLEDAGEVSIESVDTTGTPQSNTVTFDDWLSLFGGPTAYYPPGWDSHSVAQSTMVPLDGSYQPALGGPADGTGADLSAKGWPGTAPGTDYIGAKAPV